MINPTLAHFRKLLFDTAYPEWLLEHDARLRHGDRLLARVQRLSQPTAIERLRFRGSRYVGMAIFLAYLVPPSILFIPLATIVFQLGLFDTRLGADPHLPDVPDPVLHVAADGLLPRIPYELEECALIDGATRLADPHARSSCRSRCRA